MSSVLQALEGGPRTITENVIGRTIITVEASYLSPQEASGADDAARGAAWLLFLAPLGIAYMIQDFNMALGCVMASSLIAREPAGMAFRHVSRQVAKVRFTEQDIEFSWSGQWRRFNRGHTHRFVLLEHDQTRAENDQIDYQHRLGSVRGQAKPVRRYFSDAFIVAFEYFGQRFDIAEVMGRKEAAAIVNRLMLCDEMMGSLAGSQPTVVQKPEDEWQELPGGLP